MTDFKETEHPRDELGRFTDGSNTTSSKQITIKGDELGEYSDIKELRQKAIDYYKEHLQGTTVERDDIGEIRFSRKGRDEFAAFSANPDKLKIVPYLKDIINNGTLGKFRELEHTRKDNIIGFYPIHSNIILDGNNKEIEVLIAKDREGNLFYDFFIDRPKEKRTHNGYLYTNYKSAVSPSTSTITSNSLNVNPLNEENYELNIFIKEMKVNNSFHIYNQETNRTIDNNGFLYVKKSPILKSGILEYYGSELGDTIDGIKLTKDKIYKVYISKRELEKSKESFKLIPIVNDHQWLGIEGENAKDYQEGSTGENVFIENNLLMIDLKFTNLDTIQDIQEGIKEELSASYENKLIKAPSNVEYDFMATDIAANHLALVEKGRCGHSVRVLNSIINQEINNEEKMTEKQENKKTCNTDRAGLIKEIIAIATKSADEFEGGEEGKVEAITKLAEKLTPDSSETDNKSKSKNEEADKAKAENEDEKDEKEEEEDKEKDEDTAKAMNYDKIFAKVYNSIKASMEKENQAKIKAYNSAKTICGEFDYGGMSELEILNKGLSYVDLEAESVPEAEAMIKAYNSTVSKIDNSFSYEGGGVKDTFKLNF